MKKTYFFFFIVLFFSVISTINAQDPAASLTHSWNFNDGTPDDRIGDAHGTVMGAAVIADGSLFTTDPDSWMEMPGDIIAINTYEQFTGEVWFIALEGQNTGYHMICYLGNTVNALGASGWFISPSRGDDKCRAAISTNNDATPYSTESGADGPELDDAELHHVVSTIDGVEITLYIDGVLQMATPLSEANNMASLSTVFAYVGKGGYTGDASWKGEILEFNIYNQALTETQIAALYSQGATPVGVKEDVTKAPKEFKLMQNYPNPFNPETAIEFSLAEATHATLTVWDMLGRPVATLLDGEMSAGYHTVKLNAASQGLSSGIYFYSLRAGNFSDSKKFTLLK